MFAASRIMSHDNRIFGSFYNKVMHGNVTNVGLTAEPIIPHQREGLKNDFRQALTHMKLQTTGSYCHVYFKMTELIAVHIEEQDLGIVSDIESNF